MTLTTHCRTVFNYIYTAILSPWFFSHLTFDILSFIIPRARPTKQWSFRQATSVRIVKLFLLYSSLTRRGNTLTLRPGRERNRFEVIQPGSTSVYKSVLSHNSTAPEPIGVTWTPARPPPAALVRSELTVALHFHGGAFVIGNGRDEDTGFLARTLIRHMGCTHVCTPQYRLASSKNGQFPAPVQDALTTYLCLIREKGIPPHQIILSGDSAGANIVLALLRYLHERGTEDDIPVPGAVALWSPWVDVSAALHTDLRASPNYKTDYLNREFGRWGANAISAFGQVDPANPYLSPLHHPFKLDQDIPMFVHAGECEVLYDDIRDFCNRYKQLGWNICLKSSKGSPHDIILLGPRIGFAEEAEEAAREARTFFSGIGSMKLRMIK